MILLLLLLALASSSLFSESHAFVVSDQFLDQHQGQSRTYMTSSSSSSESPSTTTSSSTNIPTDLLPKVREGVDTQQAGGDSLETWDACLDVLCGTLGGEIMDRAEAEFHLARAHQWRSWASARSDMARKYIQTSLPTVEQLQAALEWLTTGTDASTENGPRLQLTSEQLAQAIREHPDVYLKNPQETYQKALKVAPPEYQDPVAFRELILERPEALQFTFNCEDIGCQSECGSCWVTNCNRG